MKAIKIFISVVFLFSVLNTIEAQEKKKAKTVFRVVEEMPVYPGGEIALRKDISEAVKYPESAKKQGISGKVYVSFVVDEKGKITDSKIARGVDPALDKEALRVMTLLKTWTPGKQRGEAVAVEYTVPIKFALDGDSKTINESSAQKENMVFLIVEDMPVFPGEEDGLKAFIMNNVKYPDDAKKEKIEGKVFVTFIVGKDGKVSDAKVERGVHASLDTEALRVINSSPDWTPGKQRGKAVAVRYTVPIQFALN